MNLLKYMQILSFVLPVAFLSCSNDTIEDVHYTPQTKIGQKLLAGSDGNRCPFSKGRQPLYSYIYNRH